MTRVFQIEKHYRDLSYPCSIVDDDDKRDHDDVDTDDLGEDSDRCGAAQAVDGGQRPTIVSHAGEYHVTRYTRLKWLQSAVSSGSVTAVTSVTAATAATAVTDDWKQLCLVSVIQRVEL